MIRVEFLKPSAGQETSVRLTLVADDGSDKGSITVIEPKSEWRFDLEMRPER